MFLSRATRLGDCTGHVHGAFRVVAAALLALFSTTSLAEDLLNFSHVRADDGLSHNSVYTLFAGGDGFIWAGTVDGLNRWDGHEVVVYRHDPLDSASLSSPIVLSLAEEGDGLWIGTADGLDRLDRARERVARHALRGFQVQSLLVDRTGALWAGTDQGLFRRGVPHAPMSPIDLSSRNLSEISAHAIVEAPDGTVMAVVHAREGQFVIPFQAGRAGAPLVLDSSWGYVQSLTYDREGRMWIKPPEPAVVDREDAAIRGAGAGASELRVYDTSTMPDGSVWMATEAGVCRWTTARARAQCEPIVPGGSWLDNYSRSVAAGPGGIVWVGTYGGLAWHDPKAKPFHRLTSDPSNPDSLGADAVSSIVRIGDALWVGTFGAGIDRVDLVTGRVRHLRHDPSDPHSLPDNVVWRILADGGGALWVGTNSGIARLDPATGRFRPILERPARSGVWDLAIDGVGRVWGSGSSLWVCDPTTWTARALEIDLGPEAPGLQAIAFIDNKLWAGAGTVGKLMAIDPSTAAVRSYDLQVGGQPLESEGIWSIRPTADGRIWLGHGRGLSRFDPSQESFEHWFPSSGLPGSVVYGVEIDRHGRVWLGTNRGLARFDETAALDAKFRSWGRSDGIASMEFNRNASHRAASGELYFGGIGGITSFDPDQIKDDERVPPIVLKSVEVLGRTPRHVNVHGLDRLTVDHDESPITFAFVALAYANATRSRYRYRLEGLDEGWIDAGHRRVATYTNVPPGHYLFHVTGSNQDGVWNESGATLGLTVLPPFWATWWFRLILLAAAATLLHAFHRFRIQKAIEVERLRLRIAGDLHDDLASELSGMSMMAELIRRREGLSDETMGRLDELRRKALEMSESMRDTAWGIHPEHDTAGAMVRRMRSTAEMLLSDLAFTFDVRGLDPDLVVPMSVRRNLHLVFKELLHNVVRHAAAGNVGITLERASSRLRLTVDDDGCGLVSGTEGDGDGLRNIRRRAESIGASFTIGERPGGGTRAVVEVLS